MLPVPNSPHPTGVSPFAMTKTPPFIKYMLLSAMTAAAMLLSMAAPARADHGHAEPRGASDRIELGVGMHAAWYKPAGYADSFTGLGLQVRHPIDNRVTFEAAASYFEAQNATATNPFSVRAYPIQASLLAYMFPRSPIQLYGIAGVGLEGSDVHDEALGRSYHYNRPGGHMGLGAQFNAGRVSFEADWRWMIYANPRASATAPPPPFTERDARLFRLGMSLYF